MKQTIYERAKNIGCQFVATCVSSTIDEWEQMMKGTRPANQKKVVKIALLAGVIDEWQAEMETKKPYFNPYTHYVSKNYIVYCHSGIEHFIKVN